DADEFFERYWATSTPVILSDLVPRWPAFGRWSPAHLRERYGEVEIEAELGRAGDVDPDINYLRHRQTLRLADYVDRVLAAGESDDLYLIARNHNLARPGLRPLLDDLALFLPVGWWHHVRALDLSISVALNAFARPNTFDWYKPGTA
ncbi:MAG: cupin-like domain-containing protein, partial [Myxococcales bacterium]|nr:cupin-like domain-containing protein [Myxococcales bacterium]